MQSFLSILPLVIIIGLFSLGWWYSSPKQKGKRGEQRVNDILSHLPKEYHILCDIVLKTKKGTTQIDHIVVSKYDPYRPVLSSIRKVVPTPTSEFFTLILPL